MNKLHHGGLMRCCVQDFWEALDSPQRFNVGMVLTKCCKQFIERRPDGDWQWVGAERQQEMEEQA